MSENIKKTLFINDIEVEFDNEKSILEVAKRRELKFQLFATAPI